MKKSKVIAVIPARNEQEHISDVLRETKKHVDKVIVVDDASFDKTGEIAKQEGALVLRHIVNLGYGGALKTGCDAALLLGADIVVILDADGQHDPKKIPSFVNTLTKNNLDVVFGQRELSKGMPLEKRFGNKFFQILSKYLFEIKLKDALCGFRAFTSDAYKKIRWNYSDYAMTFEMAVGTNNSKLKYAGIKIPTIDNNAYKGMTIIDGIKIMSKILKLKFRGKNGI